MQGTVSTLKENATFSSKSTVCKRRMSSARTRNVFSAYSKFRPTRDMISPARPKPLRNPKSAAISRGKIKISTSKDLHPGPPPGRGSGSGLPGSMLEKAPKA